MLTSNTQVSTDDGWKPIQEITTNTIVHLQGGGEAPVRTVIRYDYNGLVIDDIYTLDHQVLADYSQVQNMLFVYLHRNGHQFRLGTSKSSCPHWVLKVCDTLTEAEAVQQSLAIKYSLPTIGFDNLKYWARFTDNSSNGEMILGDFGLLPDHPFTYLPIVSACNLLPGCGVNGLYVAAKRWPYTGDVFTIMVDGFPLVMRKSYIH